VLPNKNNPPADKNITAFSIEPVITEMRTRIIEQIIQEIEIENLSRCFEYENCLLENPLTRSATGCFSFLSVTKNIVPKATTIPIVAPSKSVERFT